MIRGKEMPSTSTLTKKRTNKVQPIIGRKTMRLAMIELPSNWIKREGIRATRNAATIVHTENVDLMASSGRLRPSRFHHPGMDDDETMPKSKPKPSSVERDRKST